MALYPRASQGSGSGMPVTLLGEDFQPIAALTAAVLAEAGYCVHLARSVAHIDLPVSDVEMPGLRGGGFATRFCLLHREAGIILLSGSNAGRSRVGELYGD